MSLDVWFSADVTRILTATFEAMTSTAGARSDPAVPDAGADALDAYREGFAAALRAVAAGFGVADPACSAYREQSPGARRWQVLPAPGGERAGITVDGEIVSSRQDRLFVF